MPVSPHEFRTVIHHATFVNGTDADIVAGLYEKVFVARTAHQKIMRVSLLAEEAESHETLSDLAELLQHYRVLEELHIVSEEHWLENYSMSISDPSDNVPLLIVSLLVCLFVCVFVSLISSRFSPFAAMIALGFVFISLVIFGCSLAIFGCRYLGAAIRGRAASARAAIRIRAAWAPFLQLLQGSSKPPNLATLYLLQSL